MPCAPVFFHFAFLISRSLPPCTTGGISRHTEPAHLRKNTANFLLCLQINNLRWDNAGHQPLATWDKNTAPLEINLLRLGQTGTSWDKTRYPTFPCLQIPPPPPHDVYSEIMRPNANKCEHLSLGRFSKCAPFSPQKSPICMSPAQTTHNPGWGASPCPAEAFERRRIRARRSPSRFDIGVPRSMLAGP